MLIKGIVNKYVLTTELGYFKVSRKGDHKIEGIFDIATIIGESVEQAVEVNDMTMKVQVPVTKAKINAIYTLLTKESQQPDDNPFIELNQSQQATKDL